MENRRVFLETGIYYKDSLVGMDWIDTDGKVKTMCGLCKMVIGGRNKDIMNKLYEKEEFILHVSTHTDEEIQKGMFGK